jgi:hypothetical protein
MATSEKQHTKSVTVIVNKKDQYVESIMDPRRFDPALDCPKGRIAIPMSYECTMVVTVDWRTGTVASYERNGTGRLFVDGQELVKDQLDGRKVPAEIIKKYSKRS